MDFARRHIDEKIIRMRIDVGDVSDAQLPPTLNLLLGVGFLSITTFKNSVFFASKSPSMASIIRSEARWAGPFPLRPLAN
jgi:hypothetical protein